VGRREQPVIAAPCSCGTGGDPTEAFPGLYLIELYTLAAVQLSLRHGDNELKHM